VRRERRAVSGAARALQPRRNAKKSAARGRAAWGVMPVDQRASPLLLVVELEVSPLVVELPELEVPVEPVAPMPPDVLLLGVLVLEEPLLVEPEVVSGLLVVPAPVLGSELPRVEFLLHPAPRVSARTANAVAPMNFSFSMFMIFLPRD
jgi:hypothetical protein